MIGETISHYRVVAELAGGSEAEVYLAEDSRLGREVVLRFLPASFQYDPDRRSTFLADARAISGLRSANVAAIYDIGEHKGSIYVVMEYVEGERVSWKLESGPLSVAEAIDIASQVADALTESHTIGIVHGGLRTSMLMVTERRLVKVLELGLFRTTGPPATQVSKGTQKLGRQTALGLDAHAVSYLAPEQARTGAADQRSDIFSLGVVLYETLAGRLPFEGESATGIIDKILHEPHTSISRLNYNVPPELERIVNKCLEKDADRRYQSARELATDLRNLHRDLQAAADAGSRLLSPARQTRAINRPRAKKAIDSIAVLPFENQSGDPEVEYLCDGITESLITNLSELPKLRVMARSTVFRYKGRPSTDALDIGRELVVRSVLTGRLLQRGDSVLLKIELVDTFDGSYLWGEHYHRRISEILNLEEEMARDVSDKLRLKLTGALKKQIARRYTENTQAYQLYLKGRYHWNKRTEESIRKSIELFEKAIEVDPSYALAYAGLADAYNLLAAYSTAPLATPFLRAKATALMAIKLDDKLAEAHASLAAVKFWRDWEWEGAERGFSRAVELNPGYAIGQMWRSLFLAAMDRLEEAVAAVKLALELDPVSRVINLNLARVLHFARRYDEAVEQSLKTIEMYPDYTLALRRLGVSYAERGSFEEAQATLKQCVAKAPDDSEALSLLGYSYGLGGAMEEARATERKLVELSERLFVSQYSFARLYIGLGDFDRAFASLDQALIERQGLLVYLKVEPMFDQLRGDPRLKDLSEKIGLE